MIRRYGFIALLILITLTVSCSMMAKNNQQPALHYLVRQPKIKSEHPPLLLLLHGVGSNEQDLFSLAESLPEKYLVISVRGPITLGNNSFAWFQVDFSSGKPVIIAEQAEAARKSILQFIEDLKNVLPFDEHQVNLMGFSQGGIMSYSVALTEPEKIESIAIMSSRLLPEVKPLIASDQRLAKLEVYVSHGTKDGVLQYQYALDAIEYLKSKGLKPELHSYEEGHTINKEMLNDVVKWLE